MGIMRGLILKVYGEMIPCMYILGGKDSHNQITTIKIHIATLVQKNCLYSVNHVLNKCSLARQKVWAGQPDRK